MGRVIELLVFVNVVGGVAALVARSRRGFDGIRKRNRKGSK